MQIFGKKKKEVNILTLTPVPRFEYALNENGCVEVLIPRFTSFFGKKVLLPIQKRKFIRLKLDEYGTSTWLLLDGKRSVNDVCAELAIKHGDKIQLVEERTASFLTGLYKHRIINFKEFIKQKP